MPPPNQNTGGRPADLKQSNLSCNPAWQTNSGGRHHIFLFDGTWDDDTGVNPADFTWDQARLLWVSQADPTKAYPPERSAAMKEVWFPGAHSDVGGGYYCDALSRVALDYIWKNWNSALAAQNLPALTWQTDLAAQFVATDGLPWLRHQATGLTVDLGGVSPRTLTPCNGGLPRVHPSV